MIPDTESVGKDNGQGEITQSLSVRPMSSTRDLTPIPSDLSVYNAIKFERPRFVRITSTSLFAKSGTIYITMRFLS